MQRIFAFTPSYYEIAGFRLLVQCEKDARVIFGPDIMNTFSVTQFIESPDFILTIVSSLEGSNDMSMPYVFYRDGDLIMDYSSESEKLILISDNSWKNWKLYNTLRNNNIDDWFAKLGNLFSWSVLSLDAFVLHGVILEWHGKGIVLTAASGVGKTTHARLWRKYENALIINGDRVLLRKEKETWYAYGIPWSGSSGECVNRKIALHVIVFLSQGEKNTVNFVKPAEALSNLMPRVIAPPRNINSQTTALDLSIQCLEKVPAIHLQCRPDEESVNILKEAILKI